jgi:hypothetical protein
LWTILTNIGLQEEDDGGGLTRRWCRVDQDEHCCCRPPGEEGSVGREGPISIRVEKQHPQWHRGVVLQSWRRQRRCNALDPNPRELGWQGYSLGCFCSWGRGQHVA